MFNIGFLVYVPLEMYKLRCFNLSFCHLTVGPLKQWLPKEDEGKVEVASDIEVDEEQPEPRSDDDDT